jgi:hypothetical protein
LAGNDVAGNAALEQNLNRSLASFLQSLDKNQLQLYRINIKSRKGSPRWLELAYPFDLALIQRFILKRVFELGWTAERFGDFDLGAESHSPDYRTAHKAERIGKKYQWLAYHEVLARVADNFALTHRFSNKTLSYEGTWQVSGLRDIDPSITCRKTARQELTASSKPWWVPMKQPLWRQIPDDMAWLTHWDDLPRIGHVFPVIDPKDGSRWLTLQGFYRWDEPTPVDKEWSEIPHRGIWYHLRSYIVRKKDFPEIFAWAQKKNFMNRWMPESYDTSYVFHGELFWAPSYRDLCVESIGEKAWTRGDGNKRTPKPVVVTAQEYLWESSGYDCSVEESIRSHLPSPWLAQALDLEWNAREGEFCDSQMRVLFRDPSVYTPGPSVLLARAGKLRRFLKQNDYEIFWTLLGEKQILRSNNPFPARTEFSGALGIQDNKLVSRITRRFKRFKS